MTGLVPIPIIVSVGTCSDCGDNVFYEAGKRGEILCWGCNGAKEDDDVSEAEADTTWLGKVKDIK